MKTTIKLIKTIIEITVIYYLLTDYRQMANFLGWVMLAPAIVAIICAVIIAIIKDN